MSLGAKARQSRLQLNDNTTEVSEKLYNGIMGGTVLYGLVVNAITCTVFKEQVMQLNYITVLIAYIILGIIGICMAAFSTNPIVSFIGYNLLVVPLGLMITPIIDMYTSIDPSIVMQAFLLTAIITTSMIVASMVWPGFFSKIGAILFISLIGLVLGGLVMWIFKVDSILYSYISAIIFSLYIGYDFYRSQQYVKTVDNAVDSALDIYLDIINLFLDLLKILSKNKK